MSSSLYRSASTVWKLLTTDTLSTAPRSRRMMLTTAGATARSRVAGVRCQRQPYIFQAELPMIPSPTTTNREYRSIISSGEAQSPKENGAAESRKPIVFKYGVAYFPAVCTPEVFHVDRTGYIPLLERVGRYLVFLRPRRMGKSLLLSMMEHYYDIHYADRFDELFGHLEIGKRPTEERNSYLVFKIDFSSLDISGSPEAFEESLHDEINSAISEFKMRYQDELKHSIVINKDNAIASFISLSTAVEISKYHKKLYILIDEYDNMINEALGYMKDALLVYPSVGDEKTSAEHVQQVDAMKRKMNMYRRFFSAIKAETSNSVGRIFITGVSPIELHDFTGGFNIALNITHYPIFAEMCGLTVDEVKRGLSQIAGINDVQRDDAMRAILEHYDGLKFHRNQENKLINTTLAINFMNLLSIFHTLPENKVDMNVLPCDSTLSIVESSPLARTVIEDLYVNGSKGVYIEDSIRATLTVENLIHLAKTSEHFLLSFLFYMGALTRGDLPEGKTTGTTLVIPNLVVRKEFLDVVRRNLQWDDRKVSSSQIAVQTLINDDDVGPLCKVIADSLRGTQYNDVLHSREMDLKMMFKMALELSGLRPHSEYLISIDKSGYNEKNADLVIFGAADKTIHLEFKNIQHSLLGLSEKPWTVAMEESSALLDMAEEDLMDMKLTSQYIGIDNNKLTTVRDVWNNLVKKTSMNKELLEKKEAHLVVSFAIMRVGLYVLKYSKVE